MRVGRERDRECIPFVARNGCCCCCCCWAGGGDSDGEVEVPVRPPRKEDPSAWGHPLHRPRPRPHWSRPRSYYSYYYSYYCWRQRRRTGVEYPRGACWVDRYAIQKELWRPARARARAGTSASASARAITHYCGTGRGGGRSQSLRRNY